MRKLDKHTARATARVEREAPDSKDTATFLRRARAASLKAIGSRFGALAEEEYDKIAPVIACTLPALTDPRPESILFFSDGFGVFPTGMGFFGSGLALFRWAMSIAVCVV